MISEIGNDRTFMIYSLIATIIPILYWWLIVDEIKVIEINLCYTVFLAIILLATWLFILFIVH